MCHTPIARNKCLAGGLTSKVKLLHCTFYGGWHSEKIIQCRSVLNFQDDSSLRALVTWHGTFPGNKPLLREAGSFLRPGLHLIQYYANWSSVMPCY